MFCVIQEIETKKPNKNGYPKELISEFMQCTIMGKDCSHYYHHYGYERFERPIRKAYRISIHKSYRENGKVRKKQFAICTVNYYDLATDMFSLYDWGGGKIEATAGTLQVDESTIYELIEKKLQPIQDSVVSEFQQTEEYSVHQEHERITTIYAAKKIKFNEMYGTSSNEYDQCYDVFGNLHNPDKLREIEMEYKSRRQYERQSKQNSRSYYDKFFNNHSGGTNSSYTDNIPSNYSNDEKITLKKFYRTLSKAYHPDSNPGIDTSAEMKLLNQLKREWGV